MCMSPCLGIWRNKHVSLSLWFSYNDPYKLSKIRKISILLVFSISMLYLRNISFLCKYNAIIAFRCFKDLMRVYLYLFPDVHGQEGFRLRRRKIKFRLHVCISNKRVLIFEFLSVWFDFLKLYVFSIVYAFSFEK